MNPTSPTDAVSHLTPERWERADRQLVRKALAEFSHERLLTPEEFAMSCLNRLQLRDNEGMVDLQYPAGALQLVGTLSNPIARFARAAKR